MASSSSSSFLLTCGSWISALPRNNSKRARICVVTPSSGILERKLAARSASIRCNNEDDDFDLSSIELPPYDVYMDSTSGQLEPASGARASIPGKEYWSEGTAARVRAANAPEPIGESRGTPSYGKNPGSRRKAYKGQATSSGASETSSDSAQPVAVDSPAGDIGAPKDETGEFVIYQNEPEDDGLTEYEMDKQVGRSHPFRDPSRAMEVGEPRSSDDLWWNWRNRRDHWSRWHKRRPSVNAVFAKAMAETGQIKLYGDEPTETEATLARARRHVLKEERLQAEKKRLGEIGPIAYYSEWVKAWPHDTSREAVQKHFEETGEDQETQIINMFDCQTAGEFRIMMGTDVRIKRDPLAMRMREELIKEIWGGDPVYPTINYIHDPDEVTDYRSPEFHEPTPNMVSYLIEQGKMITKEELDSILAEEEKQELDFTNMDAAMANAVDIGDDDEYGIDDSDEVEEMDGTWSMLKSTPQLRKTQEKPKKEGPMSLEEAIDDSENLTDFLLDFDEEEDP